MSVARKIGTLIAGLAATAAFAGEERTKLKEGPGADLVRQNCVACHSVDYIPLNSPFLDAKGWEAVVTKMVKAFGAPIKPEDAGPIAEYLARNYGKR
jgi:sulfite dehydrogenase (cytochrome) subunit B